MITTLERLGTRMLNRIVPKAIAQAVQCACDPGYCWCKYPNINSACCCNSNCLSSYCFCSPSICGH